MAVFDKGDFSERVEREKWKLAANKDYDLGFSAGEKEGFDRGFKAATNKYISIGHKET